MRHVRFAGAVFAVGLAVSAFGMTAGAPAQSSDDGDLAPQLVTGKPPVALEQLPSADLAISAQAASSSSCSDYSWCYWEHVDFDGNQKEAGTGQAGSYHLAGGLPLGQEPLRQSPGADLRLPRLRGL